MYTVHVTVSHIDPDGSQSETVFLPRAVDSDGGVQDIDQRRVIPVRRGVTGRGV